MSESDVHRRLILTSKVYPRAERVEFVLSRGNERLNFAQARQLLVLTSNVGPRAERLNY